MKYKKLVKITFLTSITIIFIIIGVGIFLRLLCISGICINYVADRSAKTETYVATPLDFPATLVKLGDTFGGDYPKVTIFQPLSTLSYTIERDNKPWIRVEPTNEKVYYVGKSPCDDTSRDKMIEYKNIDNVDTRGSDIYEVLKAKFILYNNDGSKIEGPDNQFAMEWGYRNGKWSKHKVCFATQQSIADYKKTLPELFDFDFNFGYCNYNHIGYWCPTLTNYNISRTSTSKYLFQLVWNWNLPIKVNEKVFDLKVTTFKDPKNLLLFPNK